MKNRPVTVKDYYECSGKWNLDQTVAFLRPVDDADVGIGCREAGCPEYANGYERRLALEIFTVMSVHMVPLGEASRMFDIPKEGLRTRLNKVRSFLRFFTCLSYVEEDPGRLGELPRAPDDPQLTLFDEILDLPDGRKFIRPWRLLP